MSIGKLGSKVTLVRVSSSARFIEIEPFSGNLRELSRFPQYFIKAIFGWAIAVAVDVDIVQFLMNIVYHVENEYFEISRKINLIGFSSQAIFFQFKFTKY
jgi:hypothetical protein